MKNVCILIMVMLSLSAFSLPPISGRPTERWFSEDTRTNPLYRWVQAANDAIEVGQQVGTGDVYYVDSNVTTEGNGNSWDTAKNTIDEAIELCTANNGDVILVAQGHAETWASAAGSATLDVAGVTIVGCGSGDLKPNITMTHVDATMTVSGANCGIQNIRFTANLDNVKVLLTLAATCDGTIVEGCEFRDSAANKDYLVGISVAAAADSTSLIGNDFLTTAAAGGNNAILLVGADTGLVIQGNRAFGKFASGCILGSAGKHTSLFLADNVLVNAEAAVAAALKTDSTGIAARNFFGGTTSMAAAWTGSDALWCFQNFTTGAVNASSVIDPGVDVD